MANGPKPLSLIPREHGAYAQLGVSLMAGLALAPLGARGWMQAVATVAVFLASEPFLLLNGRRGEEAQRQAAPEARRRLIGLVALGLASAAAAWIGAPRATVLTILPSIGLALALLMLFLKRREHSLAGELLAAFAFSFTALPVALLGGATPRSAWLMAVALAGLHGLGTLLVRGILWSMKTGGARWPRSPVPLLALAWMLGALAMRSPWMALAPLPLLLASLRVLAVMPSPRDFRTLGWMLTLGSLLGASCVLAALA